MGWELTLLLFLGGLLLLIFVGAPIAIAFLLVGLLSSVFVIGPTRGPTQVIQSMPPFIGSFALVPIPLFILMGELLYHSGIASRGLDALNRILGPVPGRLSVLSMGGGFFFGVLSGSGVANTSMLGSLLIPEMRKRGYSKQMAAGPILGAGPLAYLLPPSALAVVVGTIGNIPIGPLLIAGIVPGLMLAVLNTGYIIVRCALNPSLAPRYAVEPTPLAERLLVVVRDIVPLFSVFIVVVGAIMGGIATPTEAAALGTFACFGLLIVYRTLTWERLKRAFLGTIQITGMILLIMGSASGYSALLAFTGATGRVLEGVAQLPVSPLLIVIGMILIVVVMGGPLEQVSILLITLPIFTPIVVGFGYEPVWFGLIMLINMDIAGLTPPLGLTLYVLKGVAPPDFSMGDVILSAVPFILIDLVVLAILVAFPELATWLPRLVLD